MVALHFSPWSSTVRPCWHCASFRGLVYAGSAARCARPNSAAVRSMPANGCSAFEREVGSDDEPDHVPTCEPLPGLPVRTGPVITLTPTTWAP